MDSKAVALIEGLAGHISTKRSRSGTHTMEAQMVHDDQFGSGSGRGEGNIDCNACTLAALLHTAAGAVILDIEGYV